MPNVQFEKEQYVVPTAANVVSANKSRPWFIRAILSLGLASTEGVANIVSLIFALGLIGFSLMLFMRSGRDNQSLPLEFQNIATYRQDIYRDF